MLIMGPACVFGPLQTSGWVITKKPLILESPEEGRFYTFPNWDAYAHAWLVAGGA